MALSRAMADAVARASRAGAASTQALSIATFRFVPADLAPAIGDARIDEYLDRLNQALLDALQRGGEAFVSNAVIARPLRAARLHRELPHLT